MPQRIQLRRAKGWRKPAGAVVVARPSKWGNPFRLKETAQRYPSLSPQQCAEFIVNEFRDMLGAQELREWYGYPSDTDIRAELGGRDLACWCPPGQACHAQVLLQIANRDDWTG